MNNITSWLAMRVARITMTSHSFSPISPALRSGHRLFQRLSPQKQVLGKRRQRVATLVVAIVAGGGGIKTHGAASMTEDFNGATITSELRQNPGGGYAFGGVAHVTNNVRAYIGTVASDFNLVDFIYQITFSVPATGGGPAIAFVGFGSGVPSSFYQEPLQAAYLRQLPDDFPVERGALNFSINTGSSVNEGSILRVPGAGTFRAQITKIGNTVTFGIDINYSGGPFVADITVTKDLGTDLSFLNNSNSRLFFGTQGPNTTFDDLNIVVLPEPSAIVASPSTLTVTEGGSSTFTVRLAAQPPGEVTVTTLRTTGDPDLDVSGGATLIFTPSNWNEPQTVTITAAVDADASNGQAAFELSATGLTSQTVTVTEADNDILVLTVVVAAPSVAEGAGPAATTVTITRNLELTHALTVTLASSDPAAATVPATAVIPAAESSVTVNVDPVDDAVVDGPAMVTITASATGYVSGTATLQVTDDDIRFEEWAGGAGLTGADALPGATPHGDGVANLLKYAFNLDGGGPDIRRLVPGTGSCGLPVLTRDDSGPAPHFRFEYLRRKFGGLVYTPVQSSTLAAGSWLPMTGTVMVTSLNATWERVVIEAPYEAGVPARFFRVEVMLPDGAPEGFVLIPAGEFQMGDSVDGYEVPVHSVYVSAFYMGKCEVTNALWEDVRTWGLSHGYTDLAAGAGKAATHPVHWPTWYDTVKWCNAKSEKEGLTPCYRVSGLVYRAGNNAPVCNWNANGYRLPTEAEWEKAARGGLSGKRFPWGDTISHGQANYKSSSSYTYDVSATRGYHPTYYTGGEPYTSPVGTFAPNGYGLYDMAGNVFEWCWDWYGSYASDRQTDPRGAVSGSGRVYRGGSCFVVASSCRVAFRYYFMVDAGGKALGFRVARSAVP